MTQIMTATEMTDGQIENAVSKLRDAMRKHRSEIRSDIAQQVLGVGNLGMMMFAPFRERAEAILNLIVRTVKVNRSRSAEEAIEATDRVQYVFDDEIFKTVPKGEGEEVEVVFFHLGRSISDNDLEEEYDLRDLKPADPISLAAVNEADPAFADKKKNATHWKDVDDRWCFVTFNRVGKERLVVVRPGGGTNWDDEVWFAGIRK